MSKLDITPELAIMALDTIKTFCQNSDDDCRVNGQKCPFDNGNCMFMDGDMPCDWTIKK